MYKHFFKRALDIIISGVALLLVGWLLILIAIFLHFANDIIYRTGDLVKPDADGNMVFVSRKDF